MPRRPRFILLSLFAHTAIIVAGLALVAFLWLWVIGHQLGGFEWQSGSGISQSNILLRSRDGRLVFGIYTPTRRGWFRGDTAINGLLDNDDTYLALDWTGFGIAGPHWAFMLLWCIVPVWWWMIVKGRGESTRRQTKGLCLHCGYDIRFSDGRCPECGEAIPPLKLRMSPQERTVDRAPNGPAEAVPPLEMPHP